MNLSKRTGTSVATRRRQARKDAARQDYEEACQAIAEGFADIDAGCTVSFEEAWVGREAEKAERANLLKRTGILVL